ncbi:MAG: hypothetical protein L6R37_003637 [Teloschistes peruensis]|nr:MAG: hypothetical protein L6R37_003637 [Teloschistes peruensis]
MSSSTSGCKTNLLVGAGISFGIRFCFCTPLVRIRATRSSFAKTSIHVLDLANRSAVHEFADSIIDKIQNGSLPPLVGIVCNAYYWNLAGPIEMTQDGYEKSFNFGSDGGRVVLFSSDAHWPGKNGLEKYPPAIPDDLELIVKPAADEKPDNLGQGFQRYAVSRLAIVTWMYSLNRHLEKEPALNKITAVAINPGNLSDSRALQVNTLFFLSFISKWLFPLLKPLIRLFDPTLRSTTEAGHDVTDLATRAAHPRDRGYFTLLKADISAPQSMDETTQQKVWAKTLQWARITRENTALTLAF